MNNVVINPYEYFADPTKGRPIFNGSIYVGIPDTDPEVPANQKQVYARQENGTEVAIPQPITTNAGGYPTYNGSVIGIIVDGSYSIKVNDKNGTQVLYSANLFSWAYSNPNDLPVTATGTTTPRLLADRFADVVNIKDFGAACDGITNDAAALILAIQTGKQVEVTEECVISLDVTQAIVLLENINNVSFMVSTVVNLPSGVITPSKRILMSNPTFHNLVLTGVDDGSYPATGVASVTGSAKNHSVTLYVADTTKFTVGSFALISGTSGTGYHQALRGCWEVLSKTSSTVTFKSTINATWPTLTITDSTIWPLNTVIRWPAGVIGLAITSTVNTIKNLVLDGSYDISTGVASDGAIDGLQVGSSPNTPETGFLESEQTNVGSVYMARVGVVRWENNATQVLGKMYGVLLSTCSCGWRGLQTARNGFIGAKGSSSSGNGASGYEAEEGGYLLASNSTAAGNWQQGYFTIGGGGISCDSSYALSNGTSGIEAKNFSHITADGVTSELNALHGATTTAGQILIGSGATVDNNGSTDVVVTEGGTVNASGASVIGTVDSDENSNSLYITPAGDVNLPLSKILENASGGKVRLDISSIGDLNFSFDPSNTGTFTGRIRIKNSGVIQPITDGVGALGRTSEFFSHVYSNNLITKSPNGTQWTISIDNSGSITAV